MSIKKPIFLFLVIFLLLLNSFNVFASEEINFSDIPEDSQLNSIVDELSSKGIIRGISNDFFGYGKDISRAEFITFLSRLYDWDVIDTKDSTFLDTEYGQWFHPYIETAVLNHAFSYMDKGTNFRPNDSLTREEAAVMIINTLGYGKLAKSKNNEKSLFTDVMVNSGYIELIRGFGIMEGIEKNKFAPDKVLTREEAVSILFTLYNKMNSEIEDVNAFYAVRSYNQREVMSEFDRISFGWASLEYEIEEDEIFLILDLPVGYEEPLTMAESNNTNNYLSIYAYNKMISDDSDERLLELLLNEEDLYYSLIDEIMIALDSHKEFDGIVINFEGMVSEDFKPLFNNFISELDNKLESKDKDLMVAVPPDLYYKGYDYRILSNSADKLILMAHDYNTKILTEEEQSKGYTYTPLTPIDKVYDTLVSVFDEETGVEDRSKVALQLSFSIAQWGVDKEGNVVNKYPYTPTYEMLYERIIQKNIDIYYDLDSQNPYFKYYNKSDELDYIIWYEDSRSISSKIELAKMFDIDSLSFWRLGNFPNYSDEAGRKVHLNILNSY